MAKNAFSLDVSNFIKSFDEGAEKTMRIVAGKTFSSIIIGSPVREGRFRANWFATGQQPSSKTTDNKDKTGADTSLKAVSAMANIKDWSTFTLTNNLPYANHLEFGLYNSGPATVGGYSKQAPAGMVRINMARTQKLLEEEAKKHLPK